MLPVALAATPVIYDGPSATEAIAQVSDRTGLPADQLTPVTFRELIAAPPATRGAAVLRHCSSAPVDMPTLRAELARAEAAWQRSEPQAAMDHLDLAVAWMSCLTALAEPAQRPGIQIAQPLEVHTGVACAGLFYSNCE